MLGGELVDVLSGIPGERTVIAETFKDAASNYLFFGLGRNGTSAQEFFYACEWLLRIRASQPETWSGARLMRDTFYDETLKKRVTRTLTLTDDQLALMCADRQWDLLDAPMEFDDFIKELRALRCRIIDENRQQIADFIRLLNSRTVSRNVLRYETIPITLVRQDMDIILSDAPDPDDLSRLIHYQPLRKCILQVRCRHAKVKPIDAGQNLAPKPVKGDLLACLETNPPKSADSPGRCSAGLPA